MINYLYIGLNKLIWMSIFQKKELKDKIRDEIDTDYLKKLILDKIICSFEKNNKDILKSIDNFLSLLRKKLGQDIIFNRDHYNLNNNIYYVDHDYNGVKMDRLVIIYEKENKFRIVENHPYFKKDIIVYKFQRDIKTNIY